MAPGLAGGQAHRGLMVPPGSEVSWKRTQMAQVDQSTEFPGEAA